MDIDADDFLENNTSHKTEELTTAEKSLKDDIETYKTDHKADLHVSIKKSDLEIVKPISVKKKCLDQVDPVSV